MGAPWKKSMGALRAPWFFSKAPLMMAHAVLLGFSWRTLKLSYSRNKRHGANSKKRLFFAP
jgi:hypothetical protein